MKTHKLESYIAQVWKGETLISQIGGTEEIPSLSYDAAREIALSSSIGDLIGRIMSLSSDYTEVYDKTEIRTGPFAQTTLVKVKRKETNMPKSKDYQETYTHYRHNIIPQVGLERVREAYRDALFMVTPLDRLAAIRDAISDAEKGD